MRPDEFFFRLSPERVLTAVEVGGFRASGFCFGLNALENRVYDVGLEDGTHLVAKFYRPGRWTREQILDEHRWLLALREAEIPVCVPLAFADGTTLHEIEDIHYAVWPRMGGRAPDELRDDEIDVLGRLLARIHDVGEATGAPHRRRLDSDTAAIEPLEFLEEQGFLPPHLGDRYRAAVETVADLYDDWSADVPFHPIHGDCHAGNLLRSDEGWLFLDFDDAIVGPAVQDVWMLLPGRDHEAVRQRERLTRAYREFRPFDDATLRLVEPLRAFRFVFYAGWIARRWEDPAFPDAFPHFGTAEYWENETRDLEEQVERILRGAGPEYAHELEARGAASEPEAELTNKDFFWDL